MGRQMTDAAAQPTTGATSPPPADEVIRTVGLTKVYPGDVKAVDRLNLTVHRGEIFGLLGPNGAGKTTTAGMLDHAGRPDRGPGLRRGSRRVGAPGQGQGLIGVVPQTNTLDRSLTVCDNLYLPRSVLRHDAQAAKVRGGRLLERFKLTERATMPVLALSGGMAQRLMVARAVMHRPSVLFLDEPTAGLDPQSRIALWEILDDLHVDGQTILLTTHYMEEADQLCKRLAIIDHGRILALDTPRTSRLDRYRHERDRPRPTATSRRSPSCSNGRSGRTTAVGGRRHGAPRRQGRRGGAAGSRASRREGRVRRHATCRSPSPRSRPSSSTSPGRTCRE